MKKLTILLMTGLCCCSYAQAQKYYLADKSYWRVDPSGSIVSSRDSGRTWQEKAIFSQQSEYGFTDIAFVKGNAPGHTIGWVIGNKKDGGKSIVLKTENQGRTWLIESLCPLPAGTTFNDLEAIDSRRAYIHCSNGITLRYMMGQWMPTVKKAGEVLWQNEPPNVNSEDAWSLNLGSGDNKAGFDTTQVLDNIEIIWQKGAKQTDIVNGDSIRDWGRALGGGDFNKDGFDDVALGYCWYGFAPAESSSQARVNIYFGSVAPDTIEDQTLYFSKGGFVELCVGDFNSDGYDDLAVGNAGSQNRGDVSVCYGSVAGLLYPPAMILTATDMADFGESVASGDVNGDSIDDLIVGAFGAVVNNWLDGKVYIYYGDTLGLHVWPDVVLKGGFYDSQEQFGFQVASGNDLNGDGYDDVLVGAPENCEAYFLAGKVYIYFGGNPMDTLPDGWVKGEGDDHDLGARKLSITKLNNKSWACFGTNYYPGGYSSLQRNGKVYLLNMTAAWDTIPEITKIGNDTLNELGYEVINLGRLSEDSLEDLGLSAFYYNPADSLYYTSAEVWVGRSTMNTDSTGTVFGPWWLWDYHRIGRAGDVDGDLKEEFLYSNPSFSYLYRVYLCKYTGPDAVAGQPPVNPFTVASLKLFENVPNPFSQQTTIKYQISKSGMVSLKVYNISGQLVKTLLDEYIPLTGTHRCQWDGTDEIGKRVAAGQYLYKLNADGEECVKKVTYIK